jgi:hypothetical protein
MDITQEQAKRTHQASHWFEQQYRRAEWSVAEREAWDRWSADADNMAEYEAIGRLRAEISAVPNLPLPSAAELMEALMKPSDP